MDEYSSQELLFGDVHNHCGISDRHGPLDAALKNAREQLDFVSITGHAHWPDMPEATPETQYIIDFHREGFARLKRVWPEMLATLRDYDREGEFVVFPGFEVHFCAEGDRNVVYRELEGEILYPDNLADLHARLAALRAAGQDSIAQPHHIGYVKGTRGIDWASFDPAFAPFVEMLSMHGCSEGSETPRPFLHTMGPSDWESTVQYGLAQGHLFGFSGGTDHHSGHPGSYGHGVTGLWADSCTREAIWEALYARRMYALTGDRIRVEFAVDGAPMGSVVEAGSGGTRRAVFAVEGGGALDAVDLIKNNRLVKRWSPCDFPVPAGATGSGERLVRTALFLELGWGKRDRETSWEVELGIDGGRILRVEPRFRGREVVSPVEGEGGGEFYRSRVRDSTDRSVNFVTVSEGNPNNATRMMQGMCLHVEMPLAGRAYAVMNGRRVEWGLEELLAGARSGLTGHMDGPSYRMNRAPLHQELAWSAEFEDEDEEETERDSYYLRVRQANDQWAWSSPVFVQG